MNLAETFDLINSNPRGPARRRDRRPGRQERHEPGIGGADQLPDASGRADDRRLDHRQRARKTIRPTTGGVAQRRRDRYKQVSRLGSPLVNEVVIGLKDKDRFNASEPKNDARFLDYVTHPTLPALIEVLFGFAGVKAPVTPRADLVQIFLTGVPGLNQPAGVVPGEMLRLNTSIAPRPPAAQSSLGVLGGDLAGYPNGRRPGDDVVDIALRAVMGVLLPTAQAPTGQLPYTDGAFVDATVAYSPEGTIVPDQALRLFRDTFPFLQVPLSGSPNPAHVKASLP